MSLPGVPGVFGTQKVPGVSARPETDLWKSAACFGQKTPGTPGNYSLFLFFFSKKIIK